jgi:hypothetical protein
LKIYDDEVRVRYEQHRAESFNNLLKPSAIAGVLILLIRIAIVLVKRESFLKSFIGRSAVLLSSFALWYLLKMRFFKYAPLVVILFPILAIIMELSNSEYFETNDGNEDQRDIMFEMLVYFTIMN